MPKLQRVEWPESGDSVDAAHAIADARKLLDAAIVISETEYGECANTASDINHLLTRIQSRLRAVENYVHHSQHE